MLKWISNWQKLPPHWLLAKWGLVPGDISGQLPYYFLAYFKQFGILRKKRNCFSCPFQINKVVRKNLITVLSKSFLVHQSWIVFSPFDYNKRLRKKSLSKNAVFLKERKQKSKEGVSHVTQWMRVLWLIDGILFLIQTDKEWLNDKWNLNWICKKFIFYFQTAQK